MGVPSEVLVAVRVPGGCGAVLGRAPLHVGGEVLLGDSAVMAPVGCGAVLGRSPL